MLSPQYWVLRTQYWVQIALYHMQTALDPILRGVRQLELAEGGVLNTEYR